MKAADIMSANPVTIKGDLTVKDAAKLMIDKNISVLPVVDDKGHLTGILTQSDFVGKSVEVPRALASIKQLFGQNFYFSDVEELYKEAQTKKISDVMSTNIKTVPQDESLDSVVHMMITSNLKRLPVMDGEKLVGIITRRNILQAFSKA